MKKMIHTLINVAFKNIKRPMTKILSLFCLISILGMNGVMGQTTLVNYSFDGSGLTGASNVTSASGVSPTMAAGGTASITYNAGVSGQAASIASSSSAKWLELTMSTTGYSNIKISFSGRSSQSGSIWTLRGDSVGGTTFGTITTLTCGNGSFANLASTSFSANSYYDNKTSIKLRFICGGTTATMRIDDIVITGTAQATSLTSGTITSSSLPSISCTNGTGASRAIFLASTNTGSASPVNGTTYVATTDWNNKSNSGNQIGSTGWYCIFNGTGTPNVTVTNLASSTTYRIMVCEYDGASAAEVYNTYSSGTNNPKNFATISSASSVSNIILNTGFTHPTNIDYTAYQAASGLTTGNSIEVGKFDIQDGGGSADGDALTTTLTACSLTVANSSNLRALAIFDGSTNVAEITSVSATSVFSGLTLSAADDGTKTFSVRATFKSAVTDNQQISFTIAAATANGAGSSFVSANAGGAATSTTGDNNRIEVSTTDIIFDQNVSTVSQNAVMSPSPTVRAVDANVNFDLDNTSDVALAISSGSTTFAVSATTTMPMVAGVATFSNLVFSTAANTNNLTATQGGNTDVSSSFNVTPSAPEINVKQNVTSLASGSGSHSAGSIVSGNSGSAITFTIENLGSANLTYSSITNSNTTDFTLNTTSTSSPIAVSGTTTFTVTFNPTTAGSKSTTITIDNNDADEGTYTFNVTGTGTVTSASDIINTAGYSYTSNVDFITKQTATTLTQANSIGVNGLTLRDGGATTDADNLATTLTAITFSTGGSTAIRTAALFDGSTNVAEVAVNGGTSIAFSGFSISTTTDGGTKDFELRVTYQTTVTDNQQITFTVSSATASSTNSGFAAANAGAAASTATGDINRIEVTADRLAFVAQPSNTLSSSAMSNVTVSANDANSNRDLDFTSSIRITSTGNLTGSPVDVAASSGLATFVGLTHSVPATSLTLNAERTSTLDWDVTSNSFDITAGPSSYIYRTLRSGNWNGITSGSETWERSANGGSSYSTVTISGDLPSSSNSTITIQNGHTVTITATVTVDEVVIQNGGVLTATSQLTVNNGTGDDISIESGGKVSYTGGPTYSSSTIRIKTGGILSVDATGLTGSGAGVNASTHVYEDGAILLYNLSSAPSTSGVTYFPNVTTEVPIFRFGQTIASAIGAGSQTIFNGRVELASGVSISWTGAGAKTFRNGIVGLGGTNTMSGSGTSWSINGTTAQLGTNGGTSLTLTNSSGINIANTTTATLVGNLNIGASTNLTVAASGGVLDAASNQLIASGASVIFTINGKLKTSKTEGLNGSASTAISSSNNPTITLGASSTIEYTSGTAQTITPRSYVNLTISGAGMKSVAAGNNQIIVTGTLTTGGLLTLKSDATGTASIGSSGTITGNVTVERYISGAGRRYRFLSSPVTTATIATLMDSIWVTGPGDSVDANRLNGSTLGTLNSNGWHTSLANINYPSSGDDFRRVQTTSIRSYDESASGNSTNLNNGYSNVTTSQALTPGQGFKVFIRGPKLVGGVPQTNQLGGAGSLPSQNPVTLAFTGPVNQGDITLNGSTTTAYNITKNTQGWNLIGNPYPCAYNLKAHYAGNTNSLGTNINATFYVYNASTGAANFDSYNPAGSGTAVGTGLPSGIIPSGSAFFIQASGTPTFTFKEIYKTATAPGTLHKADDVKTDQFEIKYYKDSVESDYLTVKMYDGATLNYDMYDIFKFRNDNLNLSAYGEDTMQLAATVIPPISEETHIKLNVEAGVIGTYKFDFTNMENFDKGVSVSLFDRFTNKTTNIGVNATYSFDMGPGENQWGKNRFELILNGKSTTTSIEDKQSNIINTKMMVYPNPASDVLNISINNSSFKNSNISIYNISGNEVLNSTMIGASTQLNIESLSNGVYFVKVKNENGFDRTVKFIK